MASLSDALNALSKSLSNDVNVTFSYDGTQRGSTVSAPSSGIYLWKDGSFTVSGSGTNIIIQGGNGQWEGALSKEYADPGMTPAQSQAMGAIINYITKFGGSNVSITLPNT